MEASADEVGRTLPVFSPKTAVKICLMDGLVIDLLTRLSLHVCEFLTGLPVAQPNLQNEFHS